MLKKLFKKSKTKSENDKKSEENRINILHEKSEQVLDFAKQKIEEARGEFFSIKHKVKNLRDTNYNLGLKHLEKGNLSEAIFRFRFMKKLWPDFFDAYYQLAYCLVLNDKLFDAKSVLAELIYKNPNYDPKAKELLEIINNGIDQLAQND